MKRIKRGFYGYLQSQRKIEIIKTTIFFALSLSVFIIGYITTETRANLLTIVAILGCLPACKSLVGAIMYCKAKGCSEELYNYIVPYTKGLDGFYDFYFTSYDKNFQVSHLVIEGKNVVGITENDKMDTNKCKEHLTSLFEFNALRGYTIKIFQDQAKYVNRLEQLQAIHEEQEIGDVVLLLKSISL